MRTPARGLALGTLLAALLSLPAIAAATAPGRNGRILISRGADIYAVEPDGSDAQKLATAPAGVSYEHPVASPDGTRIAFTALRSSGLARMHVMRSDGSNDQVITEDTESVIGLSWSPDSDRIAYGCSGGGAKRICVIDADGSNRRALTNPGSRTQPGVPGTIPILDYDPTWAPTGDRIAFARDESVWIMNSDGSGAHQIAVEAKDPDWSPDGSLLVFQETTAPSQGIGVVAPDGTGRRLIDRNAEDAFPAWSPDGSRIVFLHISESPEVQTISPDGSGRRTVASSRFPSWPSWAPPVLTVMPAPPVQPIGAVVREGLPVDASCASACTIDSRLLAPESVASAARLRVVGRTTRKLRRPGEVTLHVELNREAKARFKKLNRVTVTLKTRITPRSGPVIAKSQRISLRRGT